nr:hypothetical protein [Gemmatimonadales bacterium]
MTSRRRGSLQLLREYLEEVASEGGLSAYDEAAARAWVRVGEKPGELF